MDFFRCELNRACTEFVEKNSENADLCATTVAVASCAVAVSADSKRFLADVKQILQTKSLPDVGVLLKFLVPLYLSIGNKNAAKKVLSSYFQGLEPTQKETALELLRQKVQESCKIETGDDSSSQGAVRHVVDMLAALMDNFALGETCVSAVSASAMVFLTRAQAYFFHLFRQAGQSAVQMNSVMHDCHVTMQTVNRLTQRHLPKNTQSLLQHLSHSVLAGVLRMDVLIMMEEQMMVDCRCCCAINLILLLQMSAPDFVPQFIKYSLNLESTELVVPPWLEGVRLSQLGLSSLLPMASLSLLWGMLSMLDLHTITMTTTTTAGELSVEGDSKIQNNTFLNSADVDKIVKISNTTDVNERTKTGDTVSWEMDCEDCCIIVTNNSDATATKTVTSEVDSTEMRKGECWGEGRGGECISLVFETILKKLLSLDERCQSTASRVQCIKTITLWTTRMISCLKETAVSFSVRQRLHGEGHAIQQLFNFVWTHWNDQLDVIRQNSRIIFDNCLKLHGLASQCDHTGSDQFLLSLLYHVLAMDWGSHSKFSALSSLVPWVGSSPILLKHPHFPSTLLAQMTDQAVACHASELYEVLIGGDKKRGGATEESDRKNETNWLVVWIDPIVTQLCSSDRKLKQHIIEYILPKVMKKDKLVLEHMLNRLSSAKETGVEPLGALIVCLRRARAWGLMTEALHTQDSSAPIWTKIFFALSSPEEQVRLDAFALLCESKRTAEMISQVEFDHVRHFIANNLNNQTPAFRQAMLAFSKKLLFRVNESQQALLRQKKRKQKVPETTAALQTYSTFLLWLERFLFSQLYPSAAFARRTMSLAMLSLLVQDVQGDKDNGGYRPLGDVTVNHVHTLLECLMDTFEENKEEAYKLLLHCTSQHADLLTEDKCRVLYTAAVQLAVSTRPQDCGTAAYIFRLLLHQPSVVSIIQSCDLPLQQSLSMQETSAVQGKKLGSGEQTSAIPEKHPKEAHSYTMDTDLPTLMAEMKLNDGNDDLSPTLNLLRSLLVLLIDQVTVAQTSLIMAAANRPIYPTLHCIRYILDSVDFKSLKKQETPMWNKFISCLVQVCLQVAKVVSPVVQNSSPEGNVPEEAVLGPGLKFDLGLMAEVEESRQTVALMPEYLVVCCWRSIKEVSLLLGQLCLNVPVSQDGICEGLLSFQQMEEIGAYFKQQLMESLHRGAFELAYAGFVMMCQRLWKSPWRELQKLPWRWLEEVMSAIMSTDESSSLCATRRSAGVPFFIQAIVATETPSSGRPSFHQAMGHLLHMALSSVTSSPQSLNTDGQVHALNILRALFKDTRLGEDVASYVCDGLKAAILGFKSQHWEIRNSATLLLSALMTRIFGVKRSKDESVLSKRNSQTGRAFFHKYPALYPFLLEELEMATQNLGSSGHLHLHPSLYPVLMVLGRLFPSTMEGTTTRLNLAAFIPHVIRCSSSPVYKTRMMAARALQPLVGKEQLTSVLTSLLTSLPAQPPSSSSDSTLAHSHVHGILLQIYHLVVQTGDMSGTTLQTLMTVCLSAWLPCIWLITRQNPCLCTRKVALDITDLILFRETPVLTSLPANEKQNLDTITQHLLHVLTAEVWSPPSPLYSPHTPFLSQLLSCVAGLAMKYPCVGEEEGGREVVVLRLLESSAYEVHLTVLDWLLGVDVKAGAVRESAPQRDFPDASNHVINKPLQDKKDSTTTTVPDGTESADCQNYGITLTTAVVDRLLTMGLQDDAYPETVVKIFQLLSLPAVGNSFYSKGAYGSVFEKVLAKLQKERRSDVKAALIQFTGSLFPFFYCELKYDQVSSDSKEPQLLQEWSQLLSACCDAEEPDDLHLSCATVLRDNCIHLLADKDRCLGSLVFEFWSLLVTLLQADDLDVKDIAASVSSKLGVNGTGGSHPEQALGHLITAMFCLHADKFPDCLATVLRWVMPQASDIDEGTDRLFDKGELNTFEDSISLARVVSHSLKEVFHSHNTQASEGKVTRKPSPHLIPPLLTGKAEQASQLWPADGDSGKLRRIIQEATELMDMESSLSEAERASLECVFLKGSQYCEHTMFLIRLALMGSDLQNLPEFRTQASDSLRQVHQRVTDYVKQQVGRHPSSNFLLGSVVDSL